MTFKQQHYFYYDNKSGICCGIFLRKPEEHEYAVEIESELANKFLQGELKLSEHYISIVKGNLEVVRKGKGLDYNYSFKSKTHYCITEDLQNADCQVIWNLKSKSWNFNFSEKCKELFNSGLVLKKIFFFITLKDDFDFLIRIVDIDTDDVLKNDNFSIPFSSSFESDINKISISTYAVFSSYSLKVLYE